MKLVKFKQVIIKHHPRSMEIKKKCVEAFSDELEQELGNLAATKFSLNCNIFGDVFDQSVNIIKKQLTSMPRSSV